MAFAPDGHTLATASDDKTVHAVGRHRPDPTRSRLGDPLTGHTDGVYAVAFAPDGHTLATASCDQHGAAVGRHRPDPRHAGSATP